MSVVGYWRGGGGDGRVERARLHQPRQVADYHVVEPRHWHMPGKDLGLEPSREIDAVVELLPRLLIEASVGGFRRRMHGAPVAHHPAGIAPVVLQHIGQQMSVLAHPVAVDLVVGAHDRARPTALDGDLEGEQVAHTQRRFVDPRVEDCPPAFLGIQDVMLHRRNDAVRLNAGDMGSGHDTGEEWVLAEIFEVPAVPRIARQVDAAGQKHVEALGTRLRADHLAARAGDGRIERRGGRQARRQRRGDVALALLDLIGDAERSIALPHHRNAELRQPVDVTSRGDQRFRCLSRGERRKQAVDQRDPLVEGHAPDERLCARHAAAVRVTIGGKGLGAPRLKRRGQGDQHKRGQRRSTGSDHPVPPRPFWNVCHSL